MFLSIIESLLEKKIGLSAETIGSDTIAKAVQRRMNDCRIFDSKAYFDYLLTSDNEWDELIEMVVVPETWFFRNKESFAFLARYVRLEWLPASKDQVLRVLSLPCSTGEEPYSIAMTVMDTELPKEIGENRFYITAMDISKKALEKADSGIYGEESFRGKNLSFRERYFDQTANTGNISNYRIKKPVSSMVHFKKGNLVDDEILIYEKPYDIIFCRNLLIYLSSSGRKRALSIIVQLLAKTGILFLGHVERSFVCDSPAKDQFEWIRQPGVFACRRKDRVSDSLYPVISDQDYKRISINKPLSPPGVQADRVSRTPALQRPAKIPCAVTNHKYVRIGLKPVCDGKAPVSDSDRNQSVNKNMNLLESAQSFADQGELDEALRLCEKCLSKDAFHIQAYFLMGLICHAQDDEERAEKCFNKAVYLDPNHHEALNHLAFIMEHRGEQIRARQLRQRAQRILQKKSEKK
ncbi:MAG: tetratricopeptide repeat protein [Desulfobacterales bacterium]|nr:tetratricopeptide repeat protein [Desulfobacterales bacterium]